MAESVTVTLDTRKLDAAQQQLARGLVQQQVTFWAHALANQAKANAPVDTGNLRNSIGVVVRLFPDGAQGEVEPKAEYNMAVEYGTKAHRILPRSRKALSWPGARHPVRGVDHPGTRPRPYLRPALALVGPKFAAAIQEAIRRLA